MLRCRRGQADVVGAVAHREAALGREHDLVAHVRRAGRQPAADDLLRGAGGVHVGGVDEGAAGLDERSSCACDAASSVSAPNVIVPSASVDTAHPLCPRCGSARGFSFSWWLYSCVRAPKTARLRLPTLSPAAVVARLAFPCRSHRAAPDAQRARVADHELRVEDDVTVPMTLAVVDFLEEQLPRRAAERLARLAYGGQRDGGCTGELDVVVADQGEVLGDPQATPGHLLQNAECDQVVATEGSRRALGPPAARRS